MADDSNNTDSAARLADGQAWDAFCDALRDAGAAVLEHSPDNDIDRAEGLRYVTRLTRLAFKLCLEHSDPAAPTLIRYMDETQKFGIDNPDQLYQWARLSGRYRYRLHGPRGTAAYMGIGVYAGSAGRGGRRTVAHRNADELGPGADGGIDLVMGPPDSGDNHINLPPDTTTLLVRQTMNDVVNEEPAGLVLERLDSQGPPESLTPQRVARGLERAAAQITGSLRMFTALSNFWATQPNVLHPMDEAMARGSFGDPDLYYSGGYWKVAEDEALIIEFTPPPCRYWGFLLCNYWAESLDYRYRPVSTNKHRATYRDDGSVQLIVAHRDPGVPGSTWLDTEGHVEGTMTLRWLLADSTPVPKPRLCRVDDLLR